LLSRLTNLRRKRMTEVGSRKRIALNLNNGTKQLPASDRSKPVNNIGIPTVAIISGQANALCM
jgi:hypothetical protein